ncbi:MAG TPA: glycine cleavage system protein GcvH [Fimbriiglobus sp.]|jgi:glycine cleavage system H protein
MDLNALRYTSSDEWARLDGDTLTVGVTAFAVEQLTDVTYLELPSVGKKLDKGQEFGVIESVKATSSLYAPVAGEVVEVNAEAVKNTNAVTADPFGAGWLVKFRVAPGTNLDHMLSKAQYDAKCAGH